MSSGAKKPGDPTKSVSRGSPATSAQSPKSQSFTTPSASPHVAGSPTTSTFSGLTSRWATPALWQWRSASARMRMTAQTVPSSQPRG